MCGDGGTETDIGRRIQAGANAWSKVEGVMRRQRVTEIGGMCEEKFGGSGRGVENESQGWGSGNGWRQQ